MCIWEDDDIQHLTRIRRHFKPPQLEGDNPRREIDSGKGKSIAEVEIEEDDILK